MSEISVKKEEIYKEYYKKVYGYIISKINHTQNAEDLASEVFIKVYEKYDMYDYSKASLSTWIYTITKNTLTDYYRTRKVFEIIPENLETDFSIEDNICNAENLEILAKAIDSLDEREKTIIVSRYYSGKTLKEIANNLNISYAYVKVIQKNALEKLKKFF